MLSVAARNCRVFVRKPLASNAVRAYAKQPLENFDISKYKSVDEIPPEILTQIINMRTNELQTKSEVEMMKEISYNQTPPLFRGFVKKFMYIFAAGSIVYMSWQWLWLYLEYDEREIELNREVTSLETDLKRIVLEREDAQQVKPVEVQEVPVKKSWYKIW